MLSRPFFRTFILIGFLGGCTTQKPHYWWDQPTQQPACVVIQPGESLSTVAQKYQITVRDLALYNGLDAYQKVSVGTVLYLPRDALTEAEEMASLNKSMDLQKQEAPNSPWTNPFAQKRAVDAQMLPDPTSPPASKPKKDKKEKPEAIAPPSLHNPQIHAEHQEFRESEQKRTRPHDDAHKPKNTKTQADGNGDERKHSQKTQPAQSLWIWPVIGTLTEKFKDQANEEGITIAAPLGAPVQAARDGTVIYVNQNVDAYGALILLKHTGGFESAYAHNQNIMVKVGQRVKQGQIIASVGQSGHVSTPQLYFEIRQGLTAIDPLRFLPKKEQLT